jgi:hypothetical protein
MKLLRILQCSVFASTAETASTGNPVQHFRDQWDLEGAPRIHKLEVDINNDGQKEVFLSTGKVDPPDADLFGWQMYIGKANGQYDVAQEKTETGLNPGSIPPFRKDQYWIGLIPEINRHGLLHLECGRGGQAKCQLVAIVIEGEGWKKFPIGQPMSAESQYAELSQRFTNQPTPNLQEVTP